MYRQKQTLTEPFLPVSESVDVAAWVEAGADSDTDGRASSFRDGTGMMAGERCRGIFATVCFRKQRPGDPSMTSCGRSEHITWEHMPSYVLRFMPLQSAHAIAQPSKPSWCRNSRLDVKVARAGWLVHVLVLSQFIHRLAYRFFLRLILFIKLMRV